MKSIFDQIWKTGLWHNVQKPISNHYIKFWTLESTWVYIIMLLLHQPYHRILICIPHQNLCKVIILNHNALLEIYLNLDYTSRLVSVVVGGRIQSIVMDWGGSRPLWWLGGRLTVVTQRGIGIMLHRQQKTYFHQQKFKPIETSDPQPYQVSSLLVTNNGTP